MATISQQLTELVNQKNALAANLTTKGVEASSSETLNTLVPKVLEIQGGGENNKFGQLVDRSITTITAEDLGDITSIGDNAFNSCINLQSVDFGTNSSLQTIGEYAFNRCASLTTITIPNSVTNIGYSAFSNCSSLESVIYEGQVPNIQSYCFYNCRSIIKYDFRNCTTVPTLGIVNALGHATGCQIIIPDALYDDWTTATNWVSLTAVTFVKASEYTE